MLVAFLKGENETDARCRIAKYVDRIFTFPTVLPRPPRFDPPLRVLRTICVEVLPDSPIQIHRVQMLCPSKVLKVQDASHLLLERNTVSAAATSFDVLSREQRSIVWDGLPAPLRVVNELTFNTVPMGEHSLIDIAFNEAVSPGQRLALAITMTLRGRLTRLSFFRRELRLSYFLGPQTPPAPLDMVPADREIPCLAWHSGEPSAARVSGGFDIMVCHPANLRISTVPLATAAQGISYIDADGRPLKSPLANQLWRLRRLTNDQEVRWREHDFDIRLDIELPSTWPLFFLALAASAVVALLIATLVAPWLRRLIWGQP